MGYLFNTIQCDICKIIEITLFLRIIPERYVKSARLWRDEGPLAFIQAVCSVPALFSFPHADISEM